MSVTVFRNWHHAALQERSLKAAVLGAHEASPSATRTNAELFGLADEIGTVEPGKRADLILSRASRSTT